MNLLPAQLGKALLGLTLVTLCACQTKEPPPITDAEVTTLSQTTELQAINTLAALKNCMTLGGSLGQQAKDTYQQWQAENGKLIEASEQYATNLRTDWVEWEGATFSLKSIKLFHDISEQTRSRQNLANRGPDARSDVCASAYASAKTFGAAQTNERIISALYQRTAQQNTDIAGMLLLSDLLPSFPAPGKSFYQVTQAQKNSCSRATEIITLVNSWPTEQYASYCDGEGLALIQCEWGECTLQQPN